MTTSHPLAHPLTDALAQMPVLAELFRLFLSGKHLNRVAEPALWAELERQEASYVGLFAALGFELRLDARGFAWFHSGDANSNIGKTSRQLALVFMVISATMRPNTPARITPNSIPIQGETPKRMVATPTLYAPKPIKAAGAKFVVRMLPI